MSALVSVNNGLDLRSELSSMLPMLCERTATIGEKRAELAEAEHSARVRGYED